MKQEKQEEFFKTFPLLYADVNKSMTQTCMCWGITCGDGWTNLLWDLSEKLEAEIKKFIDEDEEKKCVWCWESKEAHDSGRVDCQKYAHAHPRAAQVKEKFGGLRFYMDYETDEMTRLIDEAEDKSEKTCDVCGEEGRIDSDRGARGGWLTCLCPKHRAEREADLEKKRLEYEQRKQDRKMAEGRGV